MKRVAIAMSLLLVLVGCGGGASSESSNDGTSQSNSAPAWQDHLKYRVSQYTVTNASCSYSDGTLEMIVDFTNLSDKKIIAVSASAKINDVFDEQIMSLNMSTDEAIAPGATIKAGSTGSSCWSLSDYDADEQRLMEMDLKTTRVVVSVSKIAFADGEVLEF
jgi:hypothetical protein